MARWLRNREAGVMEQWSMGVLDYCAFGEFHPVCRGVGDSMERVRMQYLPFM